MKLSTDSLWSIGNSIEKYAFNSRQSIGSTLSEKSSVSISSGKMAMGVDLNKKKTFDQCMKCPATTHIKRIVWRHCSMVEDINVAVYSCNGIYCTEFFNSTKLVTSGENQKVLSRRYCTVWHFGLCFVPRHRNLTIKSRQLDSFVSFCGS